MLSIETFVGSAEDLIALPVEQVAALLLQVASARASSGEFHRDNLLLVYRGIGVGAELVQPFYGPNAGAARTVLARAFQHLVNTYSVAQLLGGPTVAYRLLADA